MHIIASAISILIILVFVIVFVILMWSIIRYGGSGSKSDALIKYIHSVKADMVNYDDFKRNDYPVYRYTYNGKTYQTQARNSMYKKPKSGKNLELLVNPEEPNDIYEVYRYPIKHR